MAASRPVIALALLNRTVSPSKEALPFLRTFEKKGLELLCGNSVADFRGYPSEKLKQAEILVWIPPGDVTVLPLLWELACNVKWIHSWYVGVEPLQCFMQSCLLASNVMITNARTAFSGSLAEWVFTVALHFTKQLTRLVENSKNKQWDKFVMGELRNKTMAFIGCGDIAKTTARIAVSAFGMRCIGVKRSTNNGSEDPFIKDVCAQDDTSGRLQIFKQADFVVCTLPGTPLTYNSIRSAEFHAMKSSAIFISIGRGSVVDEDALISALDNEEIAGAALDVFQEEPLPSSSSLWGRKNVLISPHNADFVSDYSSNAAAVFDNNLKLYLSGERNQNRMYSPVERDLGY